MHVFQFETKNKFKSRFFTLQIFYHELIMVNDEVCKFWQRFPCTIEAIEVAHWELAQWCYSDMLALRCAETRAGSGPRSCCRTRRRGQRCLRLTTSGICRGTPTRSPRRNFAWNPYARYFQYVYVRSFCIKVAYVQRGYARFELARLIEGRFVEWRVAAAPVGPRLTTTGISRGTLMRVPRPCFGLVFIAPGVQDP